MSVELKVYYSNMVNSQTILKDGTQVIFGPDGFATSNEQVQKELNELVNDPQTSINITGMQGNVVVRPDALAAAKKAIMEAAAAAAAEAEASAKQIDPKIQALLDKAKAGQAVAAINPVSAVDLKDASAGS